MRRRGPLAGFFAFGIVWGGWAALVPAIQTAVGASKGELGLALFFVALGALPAMLLMGGQLDRSGPRVLPVVLTGLAIAAVLPAFADSVATLAAALLALGIASGAVDVAINGAVAELEDAIRLGRFSPDEAATIRAEGENVVAAWPFPTGWEEWRPDPAWPIPQLPDGWDRV